MDNVKVTYEDLVLAVLAYERAYRKEPRAQQTAASQRIIKLAQALFREGWDLHK